MQFGHCFPSDSRAPFQAVPQEPWKFKTVISCYQKLLKIPVPNSGETPTAKIS